MKGVTQTRDNCWMAAVASILEIPLELIDFAPEDFIGKPCPSGSPESEMHNAINARLRALGWTTAHLGTRVPRGWSVAVGPSPRNPEDHAVVAYNGVPVWDPHPSRAYTRDGLIKYYEVLIPLVGMLPTAGYGTGNAPPVLPP